MKETIKKIGEYVKKEQEKDAARRYSSIIVSVKWFCDKLAMYFGYGFIFILLFLQSFIPFMNADELMDCQEKINDLRTSTNMAQFAFDSCETQLGLSEDMVDELKQDCTLFSMNSVLEDTGYEIIFNSSKKVAMYTGEINW